MIHLVTITSFTCFRPNPKWAYPLLNTSISSLVVLTASPWTGMDFDVATSGSWLHVGF